MRDEDVLEAERVAVNVASQPVRLVTLPLPSNSTRHIAPRAVSATIRVALLVEGHAVGHEVLAARRRDDRGVALAGTVMVNVPGGKCAPAARRRHRRRPPSAVLLRIGWMRNISVTRSAVRRDPPDTPLAGRAVAGPEVAARSNARPLVPGRPVTKGAAGFMLAEVSFQITPPWFASAMKKLPRDRG